MSMTDPGRLAKLRQLRTIMPEVIVGATTAPDKLAELKDAGFQLRFDTEIDHAQAVATGMRLAQSGDSASFEDWLGSQLDVTAYDRPNVYAASTGSPPRVVESPPQQYLSGSAQLDRYSANPLADYYRAQLPGATFAFAAPEMFGAGPLPLLTASGADVSILRWCPLVSATQRRIYREPCASPHDHRKRADRRRP